MTESQKKRVCVIGAGAAGLSAARFLAADSESFDFLVFERNNGIGGIWLYTENTGCDEYGLPIHASVYQNMRTNLPKHIMSFPDFQMSRENELTENCCVPHKEILKYLDNYANNFHLKQHIQFNALVENVRPIRQPDNQIIWKVSVNNLKDKIKKVLHFDAVMVCNGHHFAPYKPTIPGLETFQGKILHSNSYRKPEDYRNEKVLLLGASFSGIDISIELSGHASEIYLSHEKEPLQRELPSRVTQVAGVERIEGNTFFLKDNTTVVVDVFIYCTGYLYGFPFLDNDCGIEIDEKCITPLYKHMININHPTMCFVGLPNIVLPFVLFHLQAQYFVAFLRGTVKLPSLEIMLEDTKLKSNEKKKDFHKFGEKQWSYYDTLIKEAKLETIAEFYRDALDQWIFFYSKYTITRKQFKFIVSDDQKKVTFLNDRGEKVRVESK